jgi:hypothetical protein
VVWEHTEFSPTGEVVSHSYGTTLRATSQPVIVTWERDVDANGEPTGEWQQSVEKYDPNQAEPGDLNAAQIGEIFGAHLGSVIAGGNPFAQVLAGSALATVLGNIGGAISWFNSDDEGDGPASLTDDLDDVAIPELSNFLTVLKGQATGAVSSFLAAELGEALGLEGLGGQLFSTVANRTIGYVLGKVVDNIATWNGTGTLDIFAKLDANQLIASIEAGIGSLVGGYLARQIVDIDSQAAAIGASLGQAIGPGAGGDVCLERAYRRRSARVRSTRAARRSASGSEKRSSMGRGRVAAARSASGPTAAPSRRARSFSVLTRRAAWASASASRRLASAGPSIW